MTGHWRLLGLTLLAGMLFSSAAVACINIHATDLQGRDVYRNEANDPTRGLRHDPSQTADYALAVTIAASRAEESPTLENRSDYAACLIRTGELQPAIQILLALEEEFPNDYSVAANLGTAYELSGDNVQALHWIEQGIARNPKSHGGSEWVHVEILKTKIRWTEAAEAAESADQPHVLNLDFGSGSLPASPSAADLERYGVADLDSLLHAVQYQLQERVEFVAAPDPIVADLMFTLAELVAVQRSVEEALPIYRIAADYGFPNQALMQSRLVELNKIQASNLRSGLRDTHAAVGFLAFIIIGIACIVLLLAMIGGAATIFLHRAAGQTDEEPDTHG